MCSARALRLRIHGSLAFPMGIMAFLGYRVSWISGQLDWVVVMKDPIKIMKPSEACARADKA
uniref:Uncharacterized protein n=1 Tax=Candidatus Kentrum sp. LFY TaxID=2126342 RepID=A0A450USQ9_9GAMM|nr:MAG: hypothetical protein BECKLFY1418A_GA0070994_105119 [Candidatus Kentron sp. LFY]